jgi:20S proteasome alpha/beta subunit
LLAPQIFEYNGSAVVAMVGKNCFAIASDRRLGVQLQTIATDFQRVFKIHDKLYIGLSGLATDAQTLWVSRILDWFGWFGRSVSGTGRWGVLWFRVWV